MLDAICHQHTAVLEGPRRHKLQVDLPTHLMERRNTGAKKDGVDIESDFVNQVRFKEGPGQLATAHQANVLAISALLLPDKYRSIFGDNRNVLVGIGLQR